MTMICAVCKGRRLLIVDINSTGQLRIERCDECSANTLTDADVENLPEAQAALRTAKKNLQEIQ